MKNHLIKTFWYIIISVCMLCFIIIAGFGQTPYKIAVLDFTSSKTEHAHAIVVREMFEIELFKQKKFQILERNQVSLILKEQGFRMTGCTDASCAVEIGKLLSADIVVFGNFDKVDEFTISAKFVHVAKGIIIAGDYEKASDEKKIIQSVKLLASRLTQQISKTSNNNKNHLNNKTSSQDNYMSSFFVNLGMVSHYNSDYRSTNQQLSLNNKTLTLGMYTKNRNFSPGIQTGFILSTNETNFYNETPIEKKFAIFPMLLSFRYSFIVKWSPSLHFTFTPTFSIGAAYLHYTENPVNNLTPGIKEKNEYFITLLVKPGINWGIQFNNDFTIFMEFDYATNAIIDKDIRLLLVNAGIEYFF